MAIQVGPETGEQRSTDGRYRVRSTSSGTWFAEMGYDSAEKARTDLIDAIGRGADPRTVAFVEQFGTMDTAGAVFPLEMRFWLSINVSGGAPEQYPDMKAAWAVIEQYEQMHPVADLRKWLDEYFPGDPVLPEALIKQAQTIGVGLWDYVNAVGALAKATASSIGPVVKTVSETTDLLPVWASLAAVAGTREPKKTPIAAFAPLIRSLQAFGLSGDRLTTTVWAIVDSL